jgi:phosphatidate cytidylyltransferase
MAHGQASAGKPPPASPPPARKPRQASPRWRDLAPRVASAMAILPPVLGTLWLGGLAWTALLTLLAAVAMLEWATLCRQKLDSPLALVAAGTLPAAQVAHLGLPGFWPPAIVLALAAAFLAGINRLLAAGVVYVGAGYAGLLFLRQGAGGLHNVLFVLLVVWATDIGAYAAGRLIGGAKMAPALSPGKTWSGAGGGLVIAIAAGLATAVYFGASRDGQFMAEGLAALLSVVAQGGDLMESALKRRSGRKDSGSLLPGHGGLLDRVDGLLAAAAVALGWHLAWGGTYLWQ